MLEAAQQRKWQSRDWTPYLWGSKALSARRWNEMELSQQEYEPQSAQMDMAGRQRAPQMAPVAPRGKASLLGDAATSPFRGAVQGASSDPCCSPGSSRSPHLPRKLSPASTAWPASKS